ncbi:MAG: HD domain-containing protein [Acidobacteria bacterium]|nr:HD domain-containing protein [Acidobacteriota bacterium]
MENFPNPIELLVIDANHDVVATIQSCFPPPRYHCVTATRATVALELLRESQFDVVLCSLRLTGMTGVQLLRRGLRTNPQAAFLMLSDPLDSVLEIEAMKIGAYDCIHKPFTCEELVADVERSLEKQLSVIEQEIFQTLVEQTLHDRAEHLHSALQRAGEMQRPGLAMLAAALDAREHQRDLHSLRVQKFTLLLAERCGYSSALMKHLSYGALLHDIGKIAIPDAILLKPARLTAPEFRIVQHHSIFGYQVLSRIPHLQQAARVALLHHERIDGEGYPLHLKRDSIPIEARIFAVADTFDVITAGRPYCSPRSTAEARTEIIRYSGSQFDKDVVDVFKAISDEEWIAAGEDVAKRHKIAIDRMIESFRQKKNIPS